MAMDARPKLLRYQTLNPGVGSGRDTSAWPYLPTLLPRFAVHSSECLILYRSPYVCGVPCSSHVRFAAYHKARPSRAINEDVYYYYYYDLIALLRYRTTSHPEDETLAVAGLLGVDAGMLVKVEGQQERMKALLMHVDELPRQLAVFGWFCDRLSLTNFTWAPMSLSDVLWPGDAEDPYVATGTEEGLFGDFTVVCFPEVVLSRSCGVIATITEEKFADQKDERVGGGDTHLRCTRAGCASRVFNLVLSPFPYKNLPRGGGLTCNGFLMKQPA